MNQHHASFDCPPRALSRQFAVRQTGFRIVDLDDMQQAETIHISDILGKAGLEGFQFFREPRREMCKAR